MALVAAHGLLFVSDVWAQPAPEESPSNLTAGLVAGGIQLDWEAPRARAAEISGYQILRRRPDAGEARLLILVADTGSAATSYLDASATEPGVEYLYRVKARRGDELSGWTNNVRLTYSAPPPAPVAAPDPDGEPGEGRGVARISGPTGATTRSVAENTAAGVDIGLPVAATDVIGTVSYTLAGADAGSFNIDAATGQLQTSAALDYETKSRYEVTVTATDSTGSVDIMVTIDVTNIVELQPLTGPATVGYEENRASRVATYSASSEADLELLSWSLSGADAGSFRIDEPGGVLRFDLPVVSPNLFSPLPDYEAPTDTGNDGTYEVTVEVGDGVTTHSLDVAVTITDQDEAGTLTLSPTRPRQGEPVTATLVDADGVTGTATYEWERSAGRNAWVTIAGANLASYTPVAADTNTFLRVTATYDDEHGTGKSVEAVPPNVVTGPLLTGLTAETANSRADRERQLSPNFSPEVLDYRIGCDDTDTLTLTAAGASDARISVGGVQVGSDSRTDVNVTGTTEVSVTVADASGSETTYVLHCFPAGFPAVATRRAPGASGIIEDLILFTPTHFIAIMDNNGVPRYVDNVVNPGLYFRFQQIGPTGDYRYSHGSTNNVQVVRDENLEVIRTVATGPPLTVTNGHDQRVLDGENSLLLSWQPAIRDLSFLPFSDEDGNTWGSALEIRDSAFQVVTPEGRAEFTWNSWGKVPLEDCSQHFFPDGYAHINSAQFVDEIFVVSLRGCSTVLAIDPDLAESHKIAWRLGQTNLSEEEWESRDLGPAPLSIINDPEGEFCAQHAAQLLENGHVVLFDNGTHCVVNPWTTDVVGRQGGFSRALEYGLDLDTGEAVFLRDHTFGGQRTRLEIAHGHVEVLNNGDWLISWGTNPRSPPPYPTSEIFTQVDPDTGEEKFGIIITSLYGSERATVMPPSNLAPQPGTLTAELPSSSHTSVFHLGATDSPQVVVAFSRPVGRLRRDLTLAQRHRRYGRERERSRGRRRAVERLPGQPHAGWRWRDHLRPPRRSGVCRRRHLRGRRYDLVGSARRAGDHRRHQHHRTPAAHCIFALRQSTTRRIGPFGSRRSRPRPRRTGSC